MLQTVNSLTNLIRAIASLVVAGVLGAAGWLGYHALHARDAELEAKQRELQISQKMVEELNRDVEAKHQEIVRLNTVVRLLKVDHRLAQIAVIDQRPSEDKQTVMTRFRFAEVDEAGNSIGQPHEFEIEGDIVYVDAWVAKFQDELIEEAEPFRSSSICLFRRVFGEYQEPKNGFPIDSIGSRPAAYSQGSEMSEQEREIWSKFWEYANDPAEAARVGLRALQGEAPYIKLLKGKLYRVQLRASDGLTIRPEEIPPAVRGDTH